MESTRGALAELRKGLYKDKTTVVWFEAWRYQYEQAPIVALLHEIRSQLPWTSKTLNTVKKLIAVAHVQPDPVYRDSVPGSRSLTTIQAGAAGIEQQALAEINAMRQRGANCGGEDMPPVPPLRMDSRLQCAARNHAMDLGTQGFENHMNPNEPDQETPAQRVALAGYPHQVLENISWGYDTAAAVVNQHWANSPGHCKNLMTPNDDIIGVGFYGGGYWTIVIGKNR